MMYFYKDGAGNEVGPLEQSVLENAIVEGVVRADTMVRTDLLSTYKKAREFRIFVRHFESGGDGRGEEAKSFRERFVHDEKRTTAFIQTHTPKNASTYTRLRAFTMDFIVLFCAALVIYGLLFFLPVKYSSREITGEFASAPGDAAARQDVKPEGEVTGEEPPAPSGKEARPADTRPIDKGVAANAARSMFPSVANVEKLNAERNAALEQAANEGKENKKEKNDGQPKMRKTLSGAWEAVPDKADAPGSDQTDGVEALKARAREAIGDVEVPELKLNVVEVRDGSVLTGRGKSARTEIKLADYRLNWRIATAAFLTAVLLYYSLTLGYYAQTLGMWYWGIFLTRNSIREAGYLRCFCYAFFTMLFNILALPFVFFCGRSPSDLICGVRVINVYGATKSQ